MSRRDAIKFLLVTVPVYLILCWFLGSCSRGWGLRIFVAGLAALIPAVGLLLLGRRGPLFFLYAAALMAVSVLGLLEGLLWIVPGVLRGNVANWAYSVYHTERGGIYRRDVLMGHVLIPDRHQWAYWNGHWWRHDANPQGFRGPAVNRADAVFLGDSLIYGHGVETDETAPSQYAALKGCACANLGMQGTGAVWAWLALRKHGPKLRPKRVFVCCHPNDPGDLRIRFPPEELERFLASPADSPHVPATYGHLHPNAQPSYSARWNECLALPLRSRGLLDGLGHACAQGILATSWRVGEESATKAGLFRPPQESVYAPFVLETPEDKLRWRCHLHALKTIQAWCRRHDAELIVYDLGYPLSFSGQIKEWADAHGARYSDAGRVVLERAMAGEAMYLPNDGHWTTEGCRAIAQELIKID